MVGGYNDVVIEPKKSKTTLKIIFMKTQIIALLTLITIVSTSFAQEKTELKRDYILYTLIVNRAPNGFNAPLIGLVNIGCGNHQSGYVGYANYVKNDFTGAQISFMNYIGGKCNGAQIGFVNTVRKNVVGAQLGFVNTTVGTFSGVQIGYVNTAVKKSNDIQVGFINTCIDSLKGAQVGFVNTSLKKTNAVQIGFVNTAKSLKGCQIGFINLIDSIESGVSLGFLSIVKKGRYQAMEFSVTEMYPVNVSYKIGVSKLYTSFVVSYNPAKTKEVAMGVGLGTTLPIGRKLCFNPEYISQTLFFNHFQQISSFTANVGLNLNDHLTVLAGPSLVWQFNDNNNQLNEPFFAFVQRQFDRGTFISGGRLSLRYKF